MHSIILITGSNECHRAILDGRLGFKIVQGFGIMFGFATWEELEEWAKMKPPMCRISSEKLPKWRAQLSELTLSLRIEIRIGRRTI